LSYEAPRVGSHPLGADFVDELKRRSPTVVLHSLPKREEFQGLTRFAPLKVRALAVGVLNSQFCKMLVGAMWSTLPALTWLWILSA
jgi:hypothetical protein